MHILGIEISEKFNQLRNSIESSYSKPIEYAPIEKISVEGFGVLDHFSSGEINTIYLSTQLKGTIFEANLLHELLHIRQIENHYPSLETNASGNPMKSEIGRDLQATVLDLDVMKRMIKLGYSSSYFIVERYKILKNLANHNFDKVVSGDHEVLLAIHISSMILTYKKKYNDYLLSKLKQTFPSIRENAIEVASIVGQNGFDTPEKCCESFRSIISLFEIWSNHRIRFMDRLITC